MAVFAALPALPVNASVRDLAAAKLAQFGYLPAPPPGLAAPAPVTDAMLVEAAKRVFAFYGRPWSPNNAAAAVVELLSNRCGVPDFASDGSSEGKCAWPIHRLTVAYPLAGWGLPYESIRRAWQTALGWWRDACDLSFDVYEDAYGNYNIAADVDTIDGAGSVLAWSYLPCGSTADSSMAQRYDAAERWTEPMATLVVAHEVGHAIGLSHSTTRAALMFPTIQPMSGLHAEDKQRAAALYGPPKAVPVPPRPDPLPVPNPTPTPPADGPKWTDDSGQFEWVLRQKSRP